jgi:hypothetical protein
VLSELQSETPPMKNKKVVKKHCCFSCQKMIVEITRYPVTQHSKEAEQHSLMKLKANCKERNDALKQLRLQGDANNNKYVTLGCRIPVRRVLRVENGLKAKASTKSSNKTSAKNKTKLRQKMGHKLPL